MKSRTSKANKADLVKKRQQRLFRIEAVRIGEYLISGGLYFWTGYIVFFVADSLFGWSLFWAKLAANILGWTVNYLLQRFWVFNNPKLSKHRVDVTGRYAVITLVNFALDYLIVYALQRMGLTPYLGQFVSAAFFTVWNYIWYKTWVFTTHIHHHPHAKKAKSRRR
jgi:putative flippase GtrA